MKTLYEIIYKGSLLALEFNFTIRFTIKVHSSYLSEYYLKHSKACENILHVTLTYDVNVHSFINILHMEKLPFIDILNRTIIACMMWLVLFVNAFSKLCLTLYRYLLM